MAAPVDLCNRGLQKLGAKLITSLDEDSRNARACNAAFLPVLNAELEEHYWSFAIQRFILAASATPPLFGKKNAFGLPSGFLKLLPPDQEFNFNDRDWVVEGRFILSDQQAPLHLRCVVMTQDVNLMPPLFREAYSTRLADELCEEITQSNAKKADLHTQYDKIIARAKKSNAIQKIAARPPEDTFLTVRY